METNYYEVLELSTKASPDMIKQAYRTLSKRFHPDMNQDEGVAERYIEVQQAYYVLSDPQQKGQYDQVMEANNHKASAFDFDNKEEDWSKQPYFADGTPNTAYYDEDPNLFVTIVKKILWLFMLVIYEGLWIVANFFTIISFVFTWGFRLLCLFLAVVVIIALLSSAH